MQGVRYAIEGSKVELRYYEWNNNNKIMSAYNNQHPRQMFNSYSGAFFANASLSPQNTYPFQPNKIIPNRQPPEYSSSDPYNQPPRSMVTQSVIFAPRNELKPKSGGLSKLQSMARVVSTTQNQDFLSQKRNSCEKAPFSREVYTHKQHNPFASQIISNSNTFNWRNNDEVKSIKTQPSESEVRKRRESVDLQTNSRKVGPHAQKFNFMQRSRPFETIKANSMVEKYDCESTNSGSGQELLKTKTFDFLKKKKQETESNNGSISPNAQGLKPFQPLKKSDIMWPLSISPMEQKSPKVLLEQQKLQTNSAGKFEYNPQPIEQLGIPISNIQFKKKKPLEGPLTPVARQQLPNRFQPIKATVIEPKLKERQQKQPILLKNRVMSKYQRQIKISDFQLVSKLGKGAFGEVYIALQKSLGFICVIKKMSKKRIKETKVEQHIIREIKLQSYLNHSHITSLYGYFHDEDNLYLVLQLLPDGSLQQVKKKKKMPEKETADIVRQVAEGLKHMHGEYIIHRDLKPQNLFINEGYVKIGDLGCSIYHHMTGLRKTIVGCLEYSSPEQLSNEGYTQKIDSWSLGIMTYELLFGKSPFESQIKKMAMSGDNKGQLSEVSFPTAPIIREDTKNFILNLLDKDPERRMDMDQVLHHSFLAEEKK